MVAFEILDAEAGTAGILFEVVGASARGGGVGFEILDVDAVFGAAFQVTLGPVLTDRFQPFDTDTLTASSVLPADSWLFERIDALGGNVIPNGPQILVGTGATRTYRVVPERVQGAPLFWRVTASKAGYPDSVAEVRRERAPHYGLALMDGTGIEFP